MSMLVYRVLRITLRFKAFERFDLSLKKEFLKVVNGIVVLCKTFKRKYFIYDLSSMIWQIEITFSHLMISEHVDRQSCEKCTAVPLHPPL